MIIFLFQPHSSAEYIKRKKGSFFLNFQYASFSPFPFKLSRRCYLKGIFWMIQEPASIVQDVFLYHNWNDGGGRSSSGILSWQVMHWPMRVRTRDCLYTLFSSSRTNKVHFHYVDKYQTTLFRIIEDVGQLWNYDDKKFYDTVPSLTLIGVAPSRDSQG